MPVWDGLNDGRAEGVLQEAGDGSFANLMERVEYIGKEIIYA